MIDHPSPLRTSASGPPGSRSARKGVPASRSLVAPLEQEAIRRPFDRPAIQLNPSTNLPSHPPEERAATGSKFWNPVQPNLRHVLPDSPSQQTTGPDEMLLNPQADGLAPGT